MSVLCINLIIYVNRVRSIFSAAKMIVLNRITIFPKEINYLEKRLAKCIGTKYVFTSNNATAGLHAAIASLSVTSDPEVYVNGLVIPSNYVGALKENLNVKSTSINIESYSFDLDFLKEKLKRDDIVIVTHYFGYSHNLNNLVEIVRNVGAKLIEDCSHCHGGYYDGKPLGSFGDISVFSFQGAKFVSGGEGGCFATSDPKLAELGARHLYQDKYTARLKNFGLTPNLGSATFGLKGRMHPLAAALIKHDLDTLEIRNRLCRVILDYLTERIPANFIRVPAKLKIGGFANGILICNVDHKLKNLLQNDFLLKRCIYERNYNQIRKSLISEEESIGQINRKIEDSTLYTTNRIFKNYFVLLRLISLLKRKC